MPLVVQSCDRAYSASATDVAACVVRQRHRLFAALDDRHALRTERSDGLPSNRFTIDPTVEPGVEDGLRGLDVVGVALEVVDDDVLLGVVKLQTSPSHTVTAVGPSLTS